ncbi:MAG: four-carbon acid sugar kinase family protein [Rubrivivax sp.]|nr:four-carbon acid sugar kinase family protein [Rubrivivax sp.]
MGCIADDFTGGTDLANNLVRAGMRTVQVIGVGAGPLPDDVDAVVVALKSRTASVEQAVAESLAAARWLSQGGRPQIYFKVCSTFDSTPQGNIGPVAEALQEALQAQGVVVTPAFPENGRTVFKGHLFVGDLLLSDSPMRNHPLTPMTDANLVRVLQAQMKRGRVGLVDHRTVGRGAAAVRDRLQALQRDGRSFAIADAVDDADLHVLAEATRDAALVVAGSGLAIGIPALHGLAPRPEAAALPAASGSRAILSGSCSAATNAQVAVFRAGGGATFVIDPLRVAAGQDLAAEALAWAAPRLGTAPVLVSATAEPAAVAAVQAQLGAERAGALVEQTLARVASGLVEQGVGQLLIAGGETSGACIQALGITQLRIGPQIDPGVPWCHARLAGRGLHVALKSGNFGGTDFFSRAFESL